VARIESAMIEGHTVRTFDGALAALHLRVLEMGGLVLEQVREAGRAFTDWDEAAAERVIERERLVNDYDLTVDEALLTLIARRQPMASDLRVIIAMSKAVNELERAGDEAKKIARTVLSRGDRPRPGTVRDARHLASLAVSLLRSAIEAFDRLDRELAQEVITRDHELDEEYAAGLRRLMTRTMEDRRGFDSALESAFALKSMERIGDHARNVGRHLLSIETPAVYDAAVRAAVAGQGEGG
jgi:phosphate transport system protein